MIVVADTGPLNYLILIGHIGILEPLYRDIIIPPAVQDEMLSPLAPDLVRSWMSNPPRRGDQEAQGDKLQRDGVAL